MAATSSGLAVPPARSGPAPGTPGGCSAYYEDFAAADLARFHHCTWPGFTHGRRPASAIQPPAPAATEAPPTAVRPDLKVDPLYFPLAAVDATNLTKRLQAVRFKSLMDTRLETLDPLHQFTSDTKLRDRLPSSAQVKPRVSATAQAMAHQGMVADVLVRRLLRLWATLSDPAVAEAVERLPQIPVRDLSVDWSVRDDRVTVLELVEAAAVDALELSAVALDLSHSGMVADMVYHGRSSNVYRFQEVDPGVITRGSWLYPHLRESSLARHAATTHAMAAGPRRPLVQSVKDSPALQLAVAHVLNDAPAMMSYYAGKHGRIKVLEREAATAQKPFIARWTKQTDSYAARDWKLRRLQDGGDRDRDAPRAPPPPPNDGGGQYAHPGGDRGDGRRQEANRRRDGGGGGGGRGGGGNRNRRRRRDGN